MRALLLALLLAGCTTTLVWDKPGRVVPPAEFQADNLRCMERAESPTAILYQGTYVEGSRTNEVIYKACMRAAGYRLVEER